MWTTPDLWVAIPNDFKIVIELCGFVFSLLSGGVFLSSSPSFILHFLLLYFFLFLVFLFSSKYPIQVS